ncbi:MAG: hypothetical protein ABIQ70_10515 [Dokdonella sp.]
MKPGEIHCDTEFYVSASGELAAKYLLVLANPPGDNIVARLLTSRAYGRPESPPCYHGAPYGGYFLGIPGTPLTQKTWVDLRYLDDLDPDEFRKREARGILARVGTLPAVTLRAVIDCVAGAEDTTRQQERQLRDTLATLR